MENDWCIPALGVVVENKVWRERDTPTEEDGGSSLTVPNSFRTMEASAGVPVAVYAREGTWAEWYWRVEAASYGLLNRLCERAP